MSDKSAPRIISPRQRRAVETRDALLNAVEELVASEGWEAVTTTRVAELTKMAVGTIYRYFADREALLLSAYDATVNRLVSICHETLEGLPSDIDVNDAARTLLTVYLDAAEGIPAHAGLLKAMRRLRPLEADQSAEPGQIESELVGPFFARFAPQGEPDRLQLHLVSAVLVTLVDLYLVAPEESRPRLRRELEAHLLFMLGRIAGSSGQGQVDA